MARVPGMQFIAPVEMLVNPAPTEWAVASANTPGGKQVVLQMMSVNGIQFYFLPAEVAKSLSQALDQAAGAGIVIVPAGAVVK